MWSAVRVNPVTRTAPRPSRRQVIGRCIKSLSHQ